jgi:hypothetical protein
MDSVHALCAREGCGHLAIGHMPRGYCAMPGCKCTGFVDPPRAMSVADALGATDGPYLRCDGCGERALPTGNPRLGEIHNCPQHGTFRLVKPNEMTVDNAYDRAEVVAQLAAETYAHIVTKREHEKTKDDSREWQRRYEDAQAQLDAIYDVLHPKKEGS